MHGSFDGKKKTSGELKSNEMHLEKKKILKTGKIGCKTAPLSTQKCLNLFLIIHLQQ